jgi:putative PEP-CTERM system TPR-repeat lipoprotein
VRVGGVGFARAARPGALEARQRGRIAPAVAHNAGNTWAAAAAQGVSGVLRVFLDRCIADAEARGLERRPWRAWGATVAFCVLVGCTAQDPRAMLERARGFERQGNPNAALVQYKAALQAAPGLAEARVGLGRLLMDQGDHEGAAVEFQRAANDGAPKAEVYPLWAEALVKTGDFKRAIHQLSSWTVDDPAARAAVLTQLALAWSGQRDRTKVEATLSLALQADPKNPAARLLKARVEGSYGRWNEAEALADALIAENPAYVDALLFKVQLLEFRNDRKQAIATAERALNAKPSSVPVLAVLVRMLLDAGERDAAAKHVDTLKAVADWHPAAVLADAQLAVARENYALARERVQSLLSALPDNQAVLTLAGLIEAKLDFPVQAIAHYRKVLSMEPGLDSVRIELARAEIRLGLYTDGLGTLQPMLSAASPPAAALALASDAHLRLGNFKQSDTLLQQAAAAAPDNTRLRTVRLVRQLQSGDADRPLADLQQLSNQTQDTYVDEAHLAARLARGEYDAAMEILDTMARKVPGQATHHELRGRVHLLRRDMAAARASFEKALEIDKGRFGAVASLVALDLLDNKPEQAIARVQRVVDADPKNSVALIALAELKVRHGGTHAESIRLLRAAAEASPLAADPRVRLVEQSLRKRRFKEALGFAQEALAALPGDPRVLEVAGRAQFEAGNVEQAAKTFRALAGLSPNAALPYMRLARVYVVQGNREAALTAVRKAIELDSSSVEAQNSLIDLLIEANQGVQAQQFVRRQREARPADPAGYVLESAYHLRTKAADKAVAVLREGLSRTGDPALARNLFSLQLQLGRDAEAARFGEDWMRKHPADAAFDYLMSVRDIARGDLKSAESRLRRVVEVYPTNGLALNNMAWVLVNGGKGGAEAVAYARRAVSVLPDQPDIMDTLASALAADGKTAEALTIQRQALDLSEGRPEIRLGLARIALQAGDMTTARRELGQLEALGTKFSEHAEVGALLKKLPP